MAHKNRSNISPMGHHKDAHLRKGKHKKPSQIPTVSEAEDRLYDIFRNHDFDDVFPRGAQAIGAILPAFNGTTKS